MTCNVFIFSHQDDEMAVFNHIENITRKNEDILILCIIDLTNLGGSELIREKGYLIKTIVDY